jgi:hypothetical protein
MAGKSPTELYGLIRDLETEVGRLTERLNLIRTTLDEVDFIGVRERVAVLNDIMVELRKRAEEAERRGERLAVLESQFGELKQQLEERDRRWWQFWVGAGLVLFTFVANLVIQLILLFSRRPF